MSVSLFAYAMRDVTGGGGGEVDMNDGDIDTEASRGEKRRGLGLFPLLLFDGRVS